MDVAGLNPLYQLEPVSGKALLVYPAAAVFQPTVEAKYDFDEMIKSSSIDDAVVKYKEAIAKGAVNSANVQLKRLYREPTYMLKALIEAAISLIGKANTKLVLTVLQTASEEMLPIDAVLVTNELINSARSDEFETWFETINKDKGDKDVVALWGDIKNDDISLEQLLEAVSLPLSDAYLKLAYADRKYWLYPSFLVAEVKAKKLPKAGQTLAPAKIEDKRRARELVPAGTK